MTRLGLFIAGAAAATAASTALLTGLMYTGDADHEKTFGVKHVLQGAVLAGSLETICLAPILTYAAINEASH